MIVTAEVANLGASVFKQRTFRGVRLASGVARFAIFRLVNGNESVETVGVGGDAASAAVPPTRPSIQSSCLSQVIMLLVDCLCLSPVGFRWAEEQHSDTADGCPVIVDSSRTKFAN